jgi:hypothetical protein
MTLLLSSLLFAVVVTVASAASDRTTSLTSPDVDSDSGSGSGSMGVDLSVPTNVSTWSCLFDELKANSLDPLAPPFAVVRVYRNLGQVSQYFSNSE